MLPPPYYLFYKSYLNERYFVVKSGSELSSISLIYAGVPQGAISSLTLYNLYKSNQSTHPSTQIAEYADDKVIYTTNTDPKLASATIKNHLNLLSPWYLQ